MFTYSLFGFWYALTLGGHSHTMWSVKCATSHQCFRSSSKMIATLIWVMWYCADILHSSSVDSQCWVWGIMWQWAVHHTCILWWCSPKLLFTQSFYFSCDGRSAKETDGTESLECLCERIGCTHDQLWHSSTPSILFIGCQAYNSQVSLPTGCCRERLCKHHIHIR